MRQMAGFSPAPSPDLCSVLRVQSVEFRGPFYFFFFCFLGPHPRHVEVPRGQVGAVAASRHHNHSQTGSGPRLRPTQLTTTLDSYRPEQGQGWNLMDTSRICFLCTTMGTLAKSIFIRQFRCSDFVQHTQPGNLPLAIPKGALDIHSPEKLTHGGPGSRKKQAY